AREELRRSLALIRPEATELRERFQAVIEFLGQSSGDALEALERLESQLFPPRPTPLQQLVFDAALGLFKRSDIDLMLAEVNAAEPLLDPRVADTTWAACALYTLTNLKQSQVAGFCFVSTAAVSQNWRRFRQALSEARRSSG
ncbi:MAG: hypothetical protein AB1758_36980, partial [Candidatus Eremiobacterota bacterium]